MGGALEGRTLRDVTERMGWAGGPQGDPSPRGCLWEGAWECEGLSREGDCVSRRTWGNSQENEWAR